MLKISVFFPQYYYTKKINARINKICSNSI